MEADVYEAFTANMEKLALDEARVDGFVDELGAIEKQAFLGALGGALRGGFSAAKGVGKKMLAGKSVGGVGGAMSKIKGQAMRHGGRHQALAAGVKPTAGLVGAPLTGRGLEAASSTALKNRLVGGAALGTAGLGAASMMGGGQRR